MGKKRKFTPKQSQTPKNTNSKAKESDTESEATEDEIDYFHSNKDKELFNKSSLSQDLDSDEEEESDDDIMPLEDDSSDSEDNQFKGLNRFAVELKKDEMASDLEDSEEELPDPNAWGNKKNVFYNTDYVDKDFRSNYFYI